MKSRKQESHKNLSTEWAKIMGDMIERRYRRIYQEICQNIEDDKKMQVNNKTEEAQI